MRAIDIEAFEPICLELIDEVEATGQAIEITRDGKAFARLEPVAEGEVAA